MKKAINILMAAAMLSTCAAVPYSAAAANVSAEESVKNLAAVEEGEMMTMKDVIELSKKGDALDWSDFDEYVGKDGWHGIGMYTHTYSFDLGEGYVLYVGGNQPAKPETILLYRYDPKSGIDIRESNIDDFLNITAYNIMTVIVTEVRGSDMLVTPSDSSIGLLTLPKKYLDDDIEPVEGMELEVTFSGGILETYPGQFGNVKKVTVVSDETKQIKGDANCDGGVDMADVVFIMQCLANPDKYKLTDIGRINADMDGNGVTVGDAQAIQRTINRCSQEGGGRVLLDKEDVQSVDRSAVAKKKFVYENEGFGGDCIIEFKEDGTFLYSPGYLSSYLGVGTWKISGNKVILTQENDGMEGKRVNCFYIVGNDLIYIEEGSDNFIGTNVKDGEKFYVAYENADKNELKASNIITIKTNYNPVMSDWSGIGILLEVDSPDCPISLRAADGHFTEWDIKTSSGSIKTVGTTYDIGKNGYIFWTPDELNYKDGFDTEIMVVGVSGDVFIDFGKIYVTQTEGGKFVASFEKTAAATDSAKLLGLKDAKIKSVNVTSLPQGYDFTFTDDKAQTFIDFLSDMELTADFSENPGELNGMTWVIKLEYENGEAMTLYDIGGFIRSENNSWFKYEYDYDSPLNTLIWELGK